MQRKPSPISRKYTRRESRVYYYMIQDPVHPEFYLELKEPWTKDSIEIYQGGTTTLLATIPFNSGVCRFSIDYLIRDGELVMFGYNMEGNILKLKIRMTPSFSYTLDVDTIVTVRSINARTCNLSAQFFHVYDRSEGTILVVGIDQIYKFNAFDDTPTVHIELQRGKSEYDDYDWFNSIQIIGDIIRVVRSSLGPVLFSYDPGLTLITEIDFSKIFAHEYVLVATKMTFVNIDSHYFDQDSIVALFGYTTDEPDSYLIGRRNRQLEADRGDNLLKKRRLQGTPNDTFGIYILDPVTYERLLFISTSLVENPDAGERYANVDFLNDIETVFGMGNGQLIMLHADGMFTYNILDYSGVDGCLENFEPGQFLSQRCRVCEPAHPTCVVYVEPRIPVGPSSEERLEHLFEGWKHEMVESKERSYSDAVFKLYFLNSVNGVVDQAFILPTGTIRRKMFNVFNAGYELEGPMDSYVSRNVDKDLALFVNFSSAVKNRREENVRLVVRDYWREIGPDGKFKGLKEKIVISTGNGYNQDEDSPSIFERFATWMLNYNNPVMEILVGIGIFLDETTLILKSSQFLRIINKLAYMDTRFSGKLSNFLEKSAGISRPIHSSRILTQKADQQNDGKFTDFSTVMDIEGKLFWKVLIYVISWLLFLAELMIVKPFIVRKGKKKHLKYLNVMRKTKFTAFGSCSIDIIFLGGRILIHKKMSAYALLDKLIISVCFLLLTFDLFLIFKNLTEIEQNFLDSIKGKKKDEDKKKVSTDKEEPKDEENSQDISEIINLKGVESSEINVEGEPPKKSRLQLSPRTPYNRTSIVEEEKLPSSQPNKTEGGSSKTRKEIDKLVWSKEDKEKLWINQPLKKFNLTSHKEPSLCKIEPKFLKLAYTLNLTYTSVRFIFQIIMISLYHSPPMQFGLVILLEFGYSRYIFFIFKQYRNHLNWVVPVSKFVQSLFLLAITIHMILINMKTSQHKETHGLQKRTVKIIIAGVISEVILLVVNKIWEFIKKKKAALFKITPEVHHIPKKDEGGDPGNNLKVNYY